MSTLENKTRSIWSLRHLFEPQFPRSFLAAAPEALWPPTCYASTKSLPRPLPASPALPGPGWSEAELEAATSTGAKQTCCRFYLSSSKDARSLSGDFCGELFRIEMLSACVGAEILLWIRALVRSQLNFILCFETSYCMALFSTNLWGAYLYF